MRELAAAFGFLTIVPVGRVIWEDDRPDAVAWYPAVGWFLGAAAAGLVWGIDAVGASLLRNHALIGALVVTGWALLTRLLHWDGLADAADGLLGSFDRERRLSIMRDSRVGAFGAIAMVLVAAVQISAIGSLVAAGSWWPLFAAPVMGRAAVTLAAWSLPPARPEGLGLTVAAERIPLLQRAIAAATVLALAVPVAAEALYPGSGWGVLKIAGVLLVGDVAALAVPRALARPVDGMTGDLYGATVLLVESAVLVTAALVL